MLLLASAFCVLQSPPPPPLRVGHFGTFDVRNWGDLLFPIVAQLELQERLAPLELVPFSYRAKNSTSWFYNVMSLNELAGAVSALDAILIGGGHLIRFDRRVARYGDGTDYLPSASWLHHPTSYWLLPALLGVAAGVPVIFNGPSSSVGLPKWASPMLYTVLHHAAYVAVRDVSTKVELLRFAPSVDISIVPDTAFGVGRLVNAREPSPQYKSFLRKHGLWRPYVLLQGSKQLHEESVWPVVRNLLKEIHAAHPMLQFVEVQIGPDVGDELGPHLGRLFAGTSDAGQTVAAAHVQITEWPSPQLLAELVAHSCGAIASSLHLSLTSISLGRPVLRPAYDKDKYKLLEAYNHSIVLIPGATGGNLHTQAIAERFGDKLMHVCGAGLGGEEAAANVAGGGVGSLGEALPVQRPNSLSRKLAAHWNQVAARIRGGRKTQVPLGTPRFLQALPFWLEGHPDQEALLDPAIWGGGGGGVPWAPTQGVRHGKQAPSAKVHNLTHLTSPPLTSLGRRTPRLCAFTDASPTEKTQCGFPT